MYEAYSYRSTRRVAVVFRRGLEDRRVAIEADAMEEETRGSFTLKLWDADGTRSVIVSGVTFP